MPKMKPNKGVMDRVKVTATGKLVRYRAGRRHLLATKTSHRKRGMRRPRSVSAADTDRLRSLLPPR